MARVENFGLTIGRFPKEVLAITSGVDTQDDRFEGSIWGWNELQAFALGSFTIWGNPRDPMTQAELDTVLKTRWPHPNGWAIGVDMTAIDSAGHATQAVYDFCSSRYDRRIYPIIGRAGTRKVWEPSKRKKDGIRLIVIGVDQVKTDILTRLAISPRDEKGQPRPGALRLSSDLTEEWFEQLTGERRVVRYVRNRAVVEFRPLKSGQQVEALDTSVYAFAARHGLHLDFAERRTRTGIENPAPMQTSRPRTWLSGERSNWLKGRRPT
jgi:phage terminase large subunit GpA-like protein